MQKPLKSSVLERFVPVLVLSAGCLSALAEAGELLIVADTPSVTVTTRPVTRNLIRLPSLEYRFRIEAACDSDETPGAVSLSIADTRVAIAADRLVVAEPVSVTIPAGQIPPITAEGFCVADADVTGTSPFITIPSVLSLQASLLCVGEGGNSMTYAATPLDVIVHCESTGAEAPVDEGVSPRLP